MGPAAKRKHPQPEYTRPITAFFERKRPHVEERLPSLERAHRDASNTRDLVEEIDADDELHADQVVTVMATPAPVAEPRREPLPLNTAHLTRLLQRRELGIGAAMLAHSVPCSSARRRKQQTEQRLERWALTRFRLLPLQLALPNDALRVVQSHRLVSHCDEFYASCLAFDSQGALLVAGSSNGVVALFDCDELFHRTINLQQMDGPAFGEPQAQQPPPELHPIHMIFTGMEVQRIRWNPMNEDEIACCFLNRNEISLYNLQKFPSKPYQILKTASRPSSGYTDLVFLPATEPERTSSARFSASTKKKSKLRTGSIIAGDVDGMVRAWDLRFPAKPQWAVSTGSQAVTSLVVSHDSQLVCGTEGGFIVIFDVRKLVVPAFGSKPMPPRKASFRLVDVLMSYLASDAAAALKYAMRDGGAATLLAVTSLQLVPTSLSQVLVQLRNQWLVVLDVSSGTVIKLHTPVKELPLPTRIASQPLPATVLHSAGDVSAASHRALASRQRHSWLHQHRCSAGLVFQGSMVCSGLADEDALSVVDLNRLDLLRIKRGFHGVVGPSYNVPWAERVQDSVERLSRFCIDTPERVTAVAVHPTQHWILCGGAELRIRVLGVAGRPSASYPYGYVGDESGTEDESGTGDESDAGDERDAGEDGTDDEDTITEYE